MRHKPPPLPHPFHPDSHTRPQSPSAKGITNQPGISPYSSQRKVPARPKSGADSPPPAERSKRTGAAVITKASESAEARNPEMTWPARAAA